MPYRRRFHQNPLTGLIFALNLNQSPLQMMFSDILPIWGCSEDKENILILGSESLLTHILRFLRSVIDISKLNEVDQESIASQLLEFLFSGR